MRESAAGLPRKLQLVLAIGGHDPSGGAGLQADIETLASAGVRAMTLVTALTTQNANAFLACAPGDPSSLLRQGMALVESVRFSAVKIGLVPTPALAAAVATLLDAVGPVPVVFDPVLAAGTGTRIAADDVHEALRTRILPRATLVTPNVHEARELGGMRSLGHAAAALLAAGTGAVLVTGTHARTRRVRNVLYRPSLAPLTFVSARLPATFHGSGCTLASAIAGRVARGLALEQAIAGALDYTWKSLAFGTTAGSGRLFPDRFFWATETP